MKRNKQAEIIKQLTKEELSFHLYITQLILVVIAIISSFFLFKNFSSFFTLFQLNLSIFTLGLTNGIAIVVLDFVCMKILPDHFYDDGGINEKIFKNRSILEIAFLAAVIAVCEELLFRGVIQTHFGLIIASVIFAIVHIRYWGHWFLIVNILLLSYWLGLVYEWSQHNLMTTIMMHFTIDFILGLIIKSKNKNME
ncbi:CPBP family intramembrane metalloprotease [Heyndrickxia sporothermodurans]|uniref:CPBP family intramembrane glutamic endopeptidase n=1 Tax=Heyndrickxia sporothermodurans TaxID=46224 RepID=UPI002E23FA46|nr:CPBP family intramembrane metalloprotease [Heyndrickxia sporothermodurans]